MKKIIFTFMILFITSTVTAQADSKADINTSNYIKLLNTNMAELDANTNPKEKATIKTTLFNGFSKGYILPSMNNEIKLKTELSELLNDIKDYSIENSFLKAHHNDLVNNIKDLISLLDESIKDKEYVLNSGNRLMSCKYIMIDDSDTVKPINEKIEAINKSYKNINKFNK